MYQRPGMAGLALITPPVADGILGIAPWIIPGSASVTDAVTCLIACSFADSISASLLRYT